MTRLLTLVATLVLLTSSSPSLGANGPTAPGAERPIPSLGDLTLTSTGTAASQLAKAAGDTFYIYGGPGTNEGKFQLPDGHTPDRQGWIGVDNTDIPVFWDISTFNAENLGGHGAGNNAAWCGRVPDPSESWVHSPGYGNNWNSALIFESPAVTDPSVGQTVSLDFVFNYDTEPGYDFFDVEYDSAGSWINLLSVSGTNHDAGNVFPAPGVQYSLVENGHGIVYAGNDYGGNSGNQVVLRIRFISDGAWSDEDGLQITQGGAAQVDDITVTWSDGASFEDFENGWFNTPWRPDKRAFAGDFSKVWPWLADGDLDECSENLTPVMAFVDGGQTVGNSASAALIPGYPTSTGGMTSPNWSYGVPGNWVLNFNGGLSQGQSALDNSVISPPIAWDLVGTADDGIDVVGAELRFSVWGHLPLVNTMFYRWDVRSSADGGNSWSNWTDRSFVYYTPNDPAWLSRAFNVSDLMLTGVTHAQIRLGVSDLGDVFGWPTVDATPSPAYDNVAFVKYRIGGPVISTREIDLAQDGFPVGGGIDVSTQAARDALDIPFDMARDIAFNNDPRLDTGDSVIADVTSMIPGTSVTDVRMFWVLDKNPLFEDAIRVAPARPKDVNVVTGATQWSGEVLGDSSRTAGGALIQDRYFFDLPDVDFLYPGDVLRYYLRATDSDGRVSTLPNDTSGFGTGFPYDRGFVVRGLPSISDAAGTQPGKLVIQDAGRGQEEVTHLASLTRNLGLVEGIDYDSYTKSGPGTGVSNGIGSAGGHGATAAQLGGYDTIVYLAGNRTAALLSDGSATGNNDKSDDLGLLTAWHALPGMRNVAHFGSALVSALATDSPAGATYVSTVLSAGFNDSSVRDEIQGQTIPLVRAWDVNFTTEFAAAGGCPNLHDFDSILPVGTATVGHVFVDPTGAPVAGPAASVFHDRLVGGDRKVDITFPYALADVYVTRQKAAGSTTSAAELLREVFGYFGVVSGGETAAAPAAKRFALEVAPNPFNPRTVIRLSGVSEGSRGSVKIYDLRGTLVATLADGELSQQKLVWEGVDDKGHAVSSGVYLVDARSGDQRQTLKVALVR